MGRRVQLQEVILNLVQNAIDAMDSNNVDRRTLKVRTKPDGAKAIIMEVEDSGPGIEAERLGGVRGLGHLALLAGGEILVD